MELSKIRILLDEYLKLPEETRKEALTIISEQERIKDHKQSLDAERIDLNVRLSIIQNRCTHPFVIKVAESDTGNYDKTQDAFWYKCECPDCGKHWTEDQ